LRCFLLPCNLVEICVEVMDAVEKGDISAFDGCVAVIGDASPETISAHDFIILSRPRSQHIGYCIACCQRESRGSGRRFEVRGGILGLVGQHHRRSPRSSGCRTGWFLDPTPSWRCHLVNDKVVHIGLLCYILCRVHHGKADGKKSPGWSGPRGVVRCCRMDHGIDGRQCGTCSRWSNPRRSRKFRVDERCVVEGLVDKTVE
jgi:hypothetical protein